MIGEVLANRYEVLSLLGKNSARRTLKARDLHTRELVVIKLLFFNRDFEWNDLKLFEREASTLQNLSHSFIPSYIDYFEVEKPLRGFALVQTYIPTQTLEQHIKSGRSFTEAEVKQIGIKLLDILIYLHSLSPPVIHRDIKPSNVLLGNRSLNHVGEVHLIDFGSVQNAVVKEFGTRTVVGTYGYMPMEQFGDRTVPASDIYSLGATLIYLLTATHPADLPQQDFRIKFEYLTNLSPVFNDWLRLMIEPSLDKRFNSAKKAIEILEKPSKISSHVAKIPKPDFLVTRKPEKSRIQLTQNHNYLEFYIPPTKLNRATINMFGCGFFILLVTVFSFIIAPITILITTTTSTLNVLVMFFSLFTFFASIVLITISYDYLISGVRHYTIRLDLHQTIIIKKFFGIKLIRTHPYNKYNIDKLVYIPEYWEKGTKNTTIKIPSHIVAWIGLNKYTLFSSNNVFFSSESEFQWFASELSQWLGVRIIRQEIM